MSSTGGALLDKALSVARFQRAVAGVVSDRAAGALDVAARHGLPTRNFDTRKRRVFFDALAEYAERESIDYIFSASYSKLFDTAFLARFPNRIYNTHHSILPAFIGPKGFARALGHGCRLIGNTVHMIDETVDGGWPLLQSALHVPYDEPPTRTRHRLFEHEVKMLIQAGIWLAEGRVQASEAGIRVTAATFGDGPFAPLLDAVEARELQLPYPGDEVIAGFSSYQPA